jgi:hypothetical protein
MSRTEYGFERTTCACRRCTINCEHVPGALAPPDLERMAAHLGFADVLEFARAHLSASDGVTLTTGDGKRVALPTLVPRAQANGHCKFLVAGRCEVHAGSPYGCAFIDAHQSNAEYALRADALYRDLQNVWQSNGLYAQVWLDLKLRGHLAPPLETRQYRLNKALRRERLL